MGIQVESLTKDKTRHQTEFIDFEFDGKKISDFGMVAVFDGDRHSFSVFPEFENETTDVNGVNGQHYWGTRMKALKKSFSLATDGMTEEQINAFTVHFQPGKYGKFIEHKLSYRYGLCRVEAIGAFNVVPFQKEIEKTIGGKTYSFSVNEYKGNCSITFVFDNPELYSTVGFINSDISDLQEEELLAAYQNNIPFNKDDIWKSEDDWCFIGKSENEENDNIFGERLYNSDFKIFNPSTKRTSVDVSISLNHILGNKSGFITPSTPCYLSTIADDINKIGTNNTIEFTKSLPIGTDTLLNKDYIYSVKFTSPSILYSINKAIQIAANFANMTPTNPVIELEEKLRLEVLNPKVSAWAAFLLRVIKSKQKDGSNIFYDNVSDTFKTSGTINVNNLLGLGFEKSEQAVNWFGYFNIYMLCLLASFSNETTSLQEFVLEELPWEFYPITFTLYSTTGRATATYEYNHVISSLEKISVSEENCGDMMMSAHLKLDGGDLLNDNGEIKTCHFGRFRTGAKPTENINKYDFSYQYTY